MHAKFLKEDLRYLFVKFCMPPDLRKWDYSKKYKNKAKPTVRGSLK